MSESIKSLRFVLPAVVAVLLLGALPARADDVFISVDEAQQLVGKEGVRFIFADSESDFEKGHIPGSVDAFAHDLQYLDDVRKCKGLPMCEPTAAAFIGQELGVDSGTKVVVYDSGMGVNASGVWFYLTLYGQKNTRILDGGLVTWQAHGKPAESGAAQRPAAKTFTPHVQWDMIASRAEVETAIKEPSKYVIVDARHKLDEYTGKTLLSALSSRGHEITVARGGFIPTAIFSPWSKYAGNKNAEADKPTLKSPAELAKQLEHLKKNGYTPDKTIISYCHVGLGRGSFQYLALKKAGHKNTKLYVGGWNEWGNTPELPLGAQPE